MMARHQHIWKQISKNIWGGKVTSAVFECRCEKIRKVMAKDFWKVFDEPDPEGIKKAYCGRCVKTTDWLDGECLTCRKKHNHMRMEGRIDGKN